MYMDSITQATLGALCGELVLGKKLGNKGILWGVLFGTLPDLDVIAYPILSASEQLNWHRGISHSILMMFIAAGAFGWLIYKFHLKHNTRISYARAACFVFLAWSTHVIIDCFNTYGTMIFKPFDSQRISINNMFIIDLFFLVPMLIGLTLVMVWARKNKALRMKIAMTITCWLCFYFMASLVTKHLANQHFERLLAERSITKERMMTAPTFSNIFLWRMVAEDQDGLTIHTSYWSFFDDKDENHDILSFKKDHHLEETFENSDDLQALRQFSGGWHKTYQDPREMNSIYIAAINMGEMHISTKTGQELRPAFIWKITQNINNSYTLERAFKMSKDGSKHLKSAVGNTITRALGNTDHWLKGNVKWTWDQFTK